MSECNHDCSSCQANCSEKEENKREDFLKPMNKASKIKKVIGVVSGKGGVGKSLVSCLLASKCAAAGLKVGILDADITGPSVPKSFGISSRATQDEEYLIPIEANGVKVMSINLLLEDVNSPVIWRGPVISGVAQQFWSDVRWGELDYLFVDMPPGTGDVALTVFQSIPLDGIIIVSTPQDLVKMIVNKAYNMAKMMNINVLGLIENMSYFECPDCKKRISVFGDSKIDETAKELGTKVIAKLPINPEINKLVDMGKIFDVQCNELDEFINSLKGE